MTKLTVEQIEEIVSACTYKPDWKINLHDDGERMYIQIEAKSLDSQTLEPCEWKSGKTYLSPFMCRQEIVGAVFSAIEKAEIHEIREFFRYRGASIFNPHLDPDVLAEVAKKKSSFNVRDNAMNMIEESVEEVRTPNVGREVFYFYYCGKEDILYKCEPHYIDNCVMVTWVKDEKPCQTEYTRESATNNILEGYWTLADEHGNLLKII